VEAEEAEVRLEADGREWGQVVEWGASPDAELGELADIFDPAEPPEWQDRALCAQTDPEAFFPEKGGSTREAKRICQGCEVKGECLEYALAHDERFGIWGGLSERERRKLKKRAV
jgi:WhiB family redox-sensing transcriptional regulator